MGILTRGGEEKWLSIEKRVSKPLTTGLVIQPGSFFSSVQNIIANRLHEMSSTTFEFGYYMNRA